MPLWMEGARPDPVAVAAEDPDTVELGHRAAGLVASTGALALRGWEVEPAGVVLRGALLAPPDEVRRRIADVMEPEVGRRAEVLVHEGPVCVAGHDPAPGPARGVQRAGPPLSVRVGRGEPCPESSEDLQPVRAVVRITADGWRRRDTRWR